MGLLQEIPKKSVKTYSDIGSIIFKKLLDLFNKNCIVLVFHRYNIQNSTKNYDRERRGESAAQTYNIVGSRKIVDYKTFLQSFGNKMALIAFLSSYIEDKPLSNYLQTKKLSLLVGIITRKIVSQLHVKGLKNLYI
jgi:hypothetical protein